MARERAVRWLVPIGVPRRAGMCSRFTTSAPQLTKICGHRMLGGNLRMRTSILIAGSVALSLLGTGCATKKYVAKSIAPVEQRVTTAEAKNTEQDTRLTANANQ